MSRPRYRWWGYVKNVVRAYEEMKTLPPEELSAQDRREVHAVEDAIAATAALTEGSLRCGIVERTLLKNSHTLEGAAQAAFVSYMTARRYQGDFIRQVARALKLWGE